MSRVPPPSPEPDPSPSAYALAGVDIDVGAALVEAIKPLARATARPGSAAGLGGFGALFDLKAAGYSDPLLVATTDGVGTKVKIAIAVNSHATIGIDLVAMCVNDLLVQGAEPLLFLDYYATSHLDVDAGRAVVAGIAEGCLLAGCALVGGETAEMPGLYAANDYDLAGFALGAVEREGVLTGANIQVGDVVLGLASQGLHSNGFSLVRRIVEQSGLAYADAAPFDRGRSLAESVLAPTRIYVKSVLPVVRAGLIKALAHITGGGLIDNIPRVLPEGLGVALDARAWGFPPVFRWLAQVGGLTAADMARVFNCGLGMVALTTPDVADEVMARLTAGGETVSRIGVVTDTPGVALKSCESVWFS